MATNSNYLGTIETEDGTIKILRKATGRDWFNGIKGHGKDRLTAYTASILCQKDDKKMTIAEVEDLDLGVVVAVERVIYDELETTPIQVETYPKTYKLENLNTGEKKTVEIIRASKLSDRTRAMKLSGDNIQIAGFYMASNLVKINGKQLRFDDFIDLPAFEVNDISNLLSPKKYKYSPQIKSSSPVKN